MSTFVLIHGAGDVGWSWHLVEAELRGRGHDVVAPDFPADNDTESLVDYADAVVDGGRRRRTWSSWATRSGRSPRHWSPSGFHRALVVVAGMIPAPGETPDEWWANTGYQQRGAEQAARTAG